MYCCVRYRYVSVRTGMYRYLSKTSSQMQIFNYGYRTRIPVDALSTAWVFGRSLAGIAGSNPTGVMDVRLFRVLYIVR